MKIIVTVIALILASCASVNTSQQNKGKSYPTLKALSIDGNFSDFKLGEKYVAKFEENDSRLKLSDSPKYNLAHTFSFVIPEDGEYQFEIFSQPETVWTGWSCAYEAVLPVGYLFDHKGNSAGSSMAAKFMLHKDESSKKETRLFNRKFKKGSYRLIFTNRTDLVGKPLEEIPNYAFIMPIGMTVCANSVGRYHFSLKKI
jgi:hypothetical protein